MTPTLLAALHAALTAAWTPYLGEAVAKERAANALQSIAAYEPGDDVADALANVLVHAREPEYGGASLYGRDFDWAITVGLNAITTVLLAHVRSDEVRFDALMQPGLR